MRVIIALLCAALLLSCEKEDIAGYVNEYAGTNRSATGNGGLPLLGDFARYEAEDAMVFGGAAVTDGDAYLYSGGKNVTNLSNLIEPAKFPLNWAGRSYVRFAVIVPKDGVYYVDLITNGPGAKTVMVRVNDIENKAHALKAAEGAEWNRLFAERFKLGLWKGVNYICITGDVRPTGDQWMNIDCIDVSLGPVP